MTATLPELTRGKTKNTSRYRMFCNRSEQTKQTRSVRCDLFGKDSDGTRTSRENSHAEINIARCFPLLRSTPSSRATQDALSEYRMSILVEDSSEWMRNSCSPGISKASSVNLVSSSVSDRPGAFERCDDCQIGPFCKTSHSRCRQNHNQILYSVTPRDSHFAFRAFEIVQIVEVVRHRGWGYPSLLATTAKARVVLLRGRKAFRKDKSSQGCFRRRIESADVGSIGRSGNRQGYRTSYETCIGVILISAIAAACIDRFSLHEGKQEHEKDPAQRCKRTVAINRVLWTQFKSQARLSGWPWFKHTRLTIGSGCALLPNAYNVAQPVYCDLAPENLVPTRVALKTRS
ncbi:hypothetical protein KCU89_g42, partial [Aureobasidium melanogenum]